MSIKEVDINILKEIILMALTYRVSYENLEKLFNEDKELIKDSLNKIDRYSKALQMLEYETLNENEDYSQMAFNNAKVYWARRNRLIKEIQKRKNNNEETKGVKQLLDNHRTLIDDSIMVNAPRLASKMTEEEKDELARYRLKYYLSMEDAKEIMKRDKSTIRKFEEEYALKDPIFAKKLYDLNSFGEFKSDRYLHNQYKGRI